MSVYKNLFTSFLDAQGVKYLEVKENVIRIGYNAENKDSIAAIVFFDDDNDVAIRCFEIAKCKNRELNAIQACNQLNHKYRWIKFYVDNDSDIIASTDAYVTEDSCGEEIFRLVLTLIDIVDKAYPAIMGAIYG